MSTIDICPGIIFRRQSIEKDVRKKCIFFVVKWLTIYTEATDETYDKLWLTVAQLNFVVFKVQACTDASIFLSPKQNDVTQGYETVIGRYQNTETIIRELAHSEAVKATSGALSCAESRYFWLQWFSDIIVVGSGNVVGANVLVQLTRLQSYNLEGLAIKTGSGSQGIWQISSSQYGLYT